MKKNKVIIIIAVVVVIIAAVLVSNYLSTANDSFLETRVKYMMDYTDKNYDDLELTKTGQELVDKQTASIDEIKSTYEAGDYTMENPLVAVDPYLQNNLAAYIIFPTEEEVSYSYVVQAKDGSNYPFEYSTEETQNGDVVIPVVGLYEDYANQVEITLTNSAGETTTSTVTVQTEKAEDKYAEGAINVTEAEKEMGLKITQEQANASAEELIDVDQATVRSEILDDSFNDYADGFILSEDYDIYDMDGNLRFSSLQGAGNNALKFDDGRYLVTSSNGLMYDMDLMGRVYHYYFTPVSDENGEELVFHHDTVVSPDGKYIYALAGFNDLGEIEENADQYYHETLILKIDRETQKTVDVWDYSDEFADGMQSAGTPYPEDPLHMNSIDYFEDANEIIVSMKNQSLIMGASAKNGDVDWIIRDPAAVSEEDQQYLLEPQGDMIYTSGNHTAFVMNTDKYDSTADDLYLSVFNNRFCVNEEQQAAWAEVGSTVDCAKSENSSMVIYHVNLVDRTVETLEEIVPDSDRWSVIRSSSYTNIPGIYQINFADMTGDDGQSISHSDLYATNEDGEVLAHVTFDGLSNIYRSRFVNEDEIGTSLDANIAALNL